MAYLASLLALSLHRKSTELEQKREELLELQDFTADIIHSMRGGLVTTDLAGRIVLINRTGEDILGRSFAGCADAIWARSTRNSGFPICPLCPRDCPCGEKLRCAHQGGQRRYPGVSVSPLRTRDASRSDHVFNFQDLTELRRLEQEVATKERKAAVGRLSAAKAREIRQPLAGAVRGLGRWCHVKKKQFVNLVSREPERLNHIIADLLNYSREKPYAFEEELPE